MITRKNEMKEVSVIENMVCNCCGNEIVSTDTGREYATLQTAWGYNSDKDGEEHKSEICEKCYDTIISTFKIPPCINSI